MFPDALKGIKRIRTATILDILLIIIRIVILLCVAVLTAHSSATGGSQAVGLTLGAGILVIASGVLALTGQIIYITGIVSASRDEPIFKKAILWLCVAAVCNVRLSVFQNTYGLAPELAIIIASVLGLCCIMKGVMALAGRLANSVVSGKAKQAVHWYVAAGIVTVIYDIISAMVELTDPHGVDAYYISEIAGSVLGLAGLILQMIALVMYIKALSGAQKMLTEE